MCFILGYCSVQKMLFPALPLTVHMTRMDFTEAPSMIRERREGTGPHWESASSSWQILRMIQLSG